MVNRVFSCAVCITLLGLMMHTAPAQAQQSASEAVDTAIRNAPAAKAARAAYEATMAGIEQDRPVLKPALTASASGTLQGPGVSLPLTGTTLNSVLPERAGRLDLVFEMPVFRTGGAAARQRYEALRQQAQLDYRKALLDIRAQIQKLFADLARAESGIRTAEAGRDAANRFAELTDHLVRAGSGKPADRDQAAAQLADAEAGVKKAHMGRDLAVMAINQAIGKPITAPSAYAPLTSAMTLPVSPEMGIRMAKAQRLEILTLKVSLLAARAGLSLAKSQTALSVNARGQLTEQTPTALLHEHYAAATVELKIPILDGGKAHSETAEAAARIKQLQALLLQAESGIEMDVRRAYLQWKQAIEDTKAASAAVTAAENALKVAEKAFEVGRLSGAEVFAAQRDARTAREREASALAETVTDALEYSGVQGDAPGIVNTLASIPVKLTVINDN